jgi:hypothetical protein
MSEETAPTQEQPVEQQPTAEPAIVVDSTPQISYIITLDELKESQSATVAKENIDRISVLAFVNPDVEDLKRKLFQWTSLGFLPNFTIYSITLEPPNKCSDGVVRNTFEYANYLLATTLSAKFQELQSKLPGMTLSYSLPPSEIRMHVSKS